MSVYTSLKSENTAVSLPKRSSAVKPNIRQTKETNETSREEDEETMKKIITPVENSMDASAMDTSEIGA